MHSALPGTWLFDMGPATASLDFSRSSGSLSLGGLNLESELLSAPVNLSLDAAFAIQDYHPALQSSGVGLSFSLDGHIGFGNGITLFGRSTWLSEMPGWGASEALPEMQFTTGIELSPQPNFSIQAG